jgi:flavin reductase (DIM6/NTAB) family NADH-FMN oxidoreductase RutF
MSSKTYLPLQTVIVTSRSKGFDISEIANGTHSSASTQGGQAISEHAQKHVSGVFDNATTFSWHGPLSVEPFLYGIYVRKSRKIYDMIQESRVFCVNFLSEDMEEMAMFCGTKSGHKIDKFKEGKIGKEECESIACPRIKGCPAYLECRLVNVLDVAKTGDHLLLVGEVVREIEKKQARRLLQSGNYAFTTTKE